MKKTFLSALFARRGVRFLVVGGVNTLFGYACYATAMGVLRLPLSWSLLVSIVAGIIFNFHSYGNLVFKTNHQGREKALVFIRFLLVYSVTYGLNLGILRWITMRDVSPYLAQFVSLFAIVPITYVLLRSIVWGGPRVHYQ